MAERALSIIGAFVFLAVVISGLYYLMVVRPDQRAQQAREDAEDAQRERDRQSQKGKRR